MRRQGGRLERRAADRLEQLKAKKRGRPHETKPHGYIELEIINQVESKTAELGCSQRRAFKALATPQRKWETIERYYRAAKRWVKESEELQETAFDQIDDGGLGDKKNT